MWLQTNITINWTSYLELVIILVFILDDKQIFFKYDQLLKLEYALIKEQISLNLTSKQVKGGKHILNKIIKWIIQRNNWDNLV